MNEPRWNLDELAERVEAALEVDYLGQPSGRVRAVPDGRAIRWYTTIGLIDRPVAYRGRTALYGPRHLLQLVAVKRLQAKGLPLVAIQQELAGATDTRLARVARLPGGIAAAAPPGAGAPATEGAAGRGPKVGGPRAAAVPARPAGFWRRQPAAFSAAASPDPDDPAASADDPRTALRATMQGIRLGEGATLLLEPGLELDSADVGAILDAAGPLLAALRDRGLDGPGDQDVGLRRPSGTEPRREHP